MNITTYIEDRWSPRAFADKAVQQSDLKELFEAAGRAPSSNNEQPWRFIVGKAGSNTYDLIFGTLVSFNQAWVKTAPVLAIGIIKETSSKNDEQNAHAEYDTGAAVSHLTMKAFEKQIYVHQMGGFNASECDALFDVPSGYKTLVAFALGYVGDKKQLHEKIAAMENGPSDRKPLEDIVFEDKFDKSVNWSINKS